MIVKRSDNSSCVLADVIIYRLNGRKTMKSALRIITAKAEAAVAIVALLEIALEALDAAGHSLPAVYIDMGLSCFITQLTEKAAHNFDEIEIHQ